MPPCGYLFEVHVVVLLRAIILTKFGSVNTRASADAPSFCCRAHMCGSHDSNVEYRCHPQNIRQ